MYIYTEIHSIGSAIYQWKVTDRVALMHAEMHEINKLHIKESLTKIYISNVLEKNKR